MLLQHLKVIFLVGGMLVDNEDVRVELGDDESQVELTNDLHVFEHLLTGQGERTNHTLSYLETGHEGPHGRNLPDLLLQLLFCTLVFSGVYFGLEATVVQAVSASLRLLVLQLLHPTRQLFDGEQEWHCLFLHADWTIQC